MEKKNATVLTEEKKADIREVVENLKHMTKESLLIMKNAAEVLKIRDSMEEKNPA